MKTTDSKLNLKKKTLEAWTLILLKNGNIDLEKYQRMIVLINKIIA